MPSEDPDYDYEAWQNAGAPRDPATGHMPDTYKLPNHPTFSDESIYHGKDGNYGGHWEQGENKNWTFVPGPTNLKHHSIDELQDYFKRVEPGNQLRIERPSIDELDPRWRMSPKQLRTQESEQSQSDSALAPPESAGKALRGYEAMPPSTRVEDRTITPRNMVHALHNLPLMQLLDRILPR